MPSRSAPLETPSRSSTSGADPLGSTRSGMGEAPVTAGKRDVRYEQRVSFANWLRECSQDSPALHASISADAGPVYGGVTIRGSCLEHPQSPRPFPAEVES